MDKALPSLVINSDTLSLKKLLKDAQELNPLYRRLASQLRNRAQYNASLTLLTGLRSQQYSIDEDSLLRYEERVLIPAQEALQHQLLETYHNYGSIGY